MKIRHGFVSNSSSSSFIIRTDGGYKTVYDVAKRIMVDMQDSDINYNDELRELENVSDKDTPVYFDSCDGGYIRKFKDYIIVSTTNHYNAASLEKDMVAFNDIATGYFKELGYFDGSDYFDDSEDDDERSIKIESNEDFDYYWSQFNDFLLLKSGLYGVWDYDFKKTYCDCGNGRIVKMKNGDTICGCKATKQYSRKLKLDKIENNEN